MSANRGRIIELARMYGYMDGYARIQDTGKHEPTPKAPAALVRRIVTIELQERGKALWALPVAAFLHRHTIQHTYANGYWAGEQRARSARAVPVRPAIWVLPQAMRDQA